MAATTGFLVPKICKADCTNAVVEIVVLLSPFEAVGAVGVPARAGEVATTNVLPVPV